MGGAAAVLAALGPPGNYLAGSAGGGQTRQCAGEALHAAGWSARRPGDLRGDERGRGQNALTGSSLGPQGRRRPTALVPGAQPGLGVGTLPGRLPTVTHQTHGHPARESGARWSRRPGPPPCSGTTEEGALTVAEAVVECPRGRAGDDGILGDPRFSRGVSTEGDHVEGKLGDNPQGARVQGPREFGTASLVG